MKKRFLRILILGICCSFLFVGGSFANFLEHGNEPSSFEQKEEAYDKNDRSYTSITSTILELIEVDEAETIEAIVYLGDNYGEDSGYYILDVNKSFRDEDNVKEERTKFVSVGVTEEYLLIFFSQQGGGGCAWVDSEHTLFSDPSNVRKVNIDGKDYLVLEDNGRELHWEKVAYEDILDPK